MLEVKNLSFSYDKKDLVLDDISFNIQDHKLVGVLGKNGVGKSTLMKCVIGLLKSYNGEIIIDGKNVKSLSLNECSKLIGYVPQQVEFSNSTVFDSVLIGRRPYFKFDARDEDLQIVNDVLHQLHMEDLAFKNINNLSGGERQKVAIARALVQSPKLLYLDEPTSNLDIKNQIDVLNLIREITIVKDIICIVNIHDLNLALRFFDSLIILKDSKIIKNTADEDLTSQDIEGAFGIKVDIVEINNKKNIIIKDY